MLEQIVTFTPAAAAIGWYRVARATNLLGGSFTITSDFYDGKIESLMFDVNYAGYGQGGTITQRTHSAYGNVVTQARVYASNNGAVVYLDLFINSATAPTPLTIKMVNFAAKAQTVLQAPAVGVYTPVTGDTPVSLTFKAGLNTSGGLAFAGDMNVNGLVPTVKINRTSGSGYAYLAFADAGANSRLWRMDFENQAYAWVKPDGTVLALFDSNGRLISQGYLACKTGFITTPSSGITVNAGTTINSTASVLLLNPGGANVVMTSTPHITARNDGTHITLVNYNATNSVTLQSNATLTNSAIYLGGKSTLLLAPGQTAEFVYLAVMGGYVLKATTGTLT
ncbi:hypothetical protein [Deinococcus marmoris]|nr:hypothetical protein [Deinococcus marmoris]